MSQPRARDAEALRQEFDLGFARPAPGPAPPAERLLLITAGGETHAVRLEELAGVVKDPRICSLPSPRPEFLGVTGYRGTTLPVYDLRRLLGLPAREAPRWLLVTGRGGAVGLACDAFVGHWQTGAEHIVEAAAPRAGPALVRHTVRDGQRAAPLLSLAAILESIQQGAGRPESEET
jgi:purine-binding chemotaxis protein CheW